MLPRACVCEEDKGEGFRGAKKTLESRREPLKGTDLYKVRAEAGSRGVCVHLSRSVRLCSHLLAAVSLT